MKKVITAYKGFDKDLKCRDFQYEVGEKYTHGGDIRPCGSGFHACENPLDVFGFYAPSTSRFAEVVLSGEIKSETDKSCSSVISIKAEITLNIMIENAVKFIHAGLKKERTKGAVRRAKRSHASNTGDSSAASNTGDSSAASNTGDSSAASNTGYRSAASNTGDRSAASNTGYRSAASNTGDSSAASNTGYRSAASVEGKESVAIVTGYKSKAKASKGGWIVLVERNDDYEIIKIKSACAGKTKGVKPDTYYMLEDGKFAEVK